MCTEIIFLSLSLMCLVIYTESEVNKNEEIVTFCDDNTVNGVLFNGIQYKLTRYDLMANFDESNATVGPLYELDILKKAPILNEDDYNEMHYQSMYFVDIPSDKDCDKMGSSCAHFREIRNKVLAFTYDSNGKQYISRTLMDDKQVLPFLPQLFDESRDCVLDPNLYDSNRGKRWPKYIACPQHTFKPSTYWPNKQLLIVIFNAVSTSNIVTNVNVSIPAVIATRSTVIPDWANGWQLFNINEKQKLVYLTAFWWKYTDKVYVVAEETDKIGGYVFLFDHTNPQNLIPTNLRAIDFFGCNGTAVGFGSGFTTNAEFDSTSITSDNGFNKSRIIAYIIVSVVIVVILVLIVLLILICVICKRKAASSQNRITIRSDDQSKGLLKKFKLVRTHNTIESNSGKTTEDSKRTAKTSSTDDAKETSQTSVNTIDSDTGKQVKQVD